MPELVAVLQSSVHRLAGLEETGLLESKFNSPLNQKSQTIGHQLNLARWRVLFDLTQVQNQINYWYFKIENFTQ